MTKPPVNTRACGAGVPMSPVGVQTVKAGVAHPIEQVPRFILFHGKRHPQQVGVAEVEACLTHLAVERGVASATQSQAKAALLVQMSGTMGLLASLLYGTGMRLLEGPRPRATWARLARRPRCRGLARSAPARPAARAATAAGRPR